MATQVATRGWFFYIGLGIAWPGLVSLVFFVMVPDPPKNVALLVYAVVQVWIYELAFTLVGFVALWFARLPFGAKVGVPSTRAAKLFLWTSLVVSPLALVSLVLRSY